MKQQTITPPSDAARTELAQLEEQFEKLCGYESDQLTQLALLRTEHDGVLRSADPAKPAAIAKASAKLRADIAELESTVADCRGLQDRLWTDILGRRKKLQEVETIDQRKRAAYAVNALAVHGAPIDRLGAQMVTAISRLRAAANDARGQVEPIMQAMNPDPMVMEDVRQIVLPRASAAGPEMAAAVAAILYAIAKASGTDLGAYVTFNELIRGNLTMAQALTAGAQYVGNRLGVQS